MQFQWAMQEYYSIVMTTITFHTIHVHVGALENYTKSNNNNFNKDVTRTLIRGTQRQFSKNICSEDDLRSRMFGTCVVKFLACLPLLRFSNI